MRILKLVPILVLLLLLSGQTLFPSGQAYATHLPCCECGMPCYEDCTCPGTWPCWYCRAGDIFPLDMRVHDEPLRFSAKKLIVIDRLMRPVNAKCLHGNLILKLFDAGNEDRHAELQIGL